MPSGDSPPEEGKGHFIGKRRDCYGNDRQQEHGGVQGLQTKVFDPAALPLALFGLVLVVPQHGGEIGERGEEFVLTG